MAKTKSTIQRDSVFRRSGGQTELRPQTQGIQPQVEEKPNRQTAVWLSDHEVDWLDDKIKQIKRGGWRGVSRSALIRAIIQSAKQADETAEIKLEGVSGETEITQRFVSRRLQNQNEPSSVTNS
jgi:hypothetical protein